MKNNNFKWTEKLVQQHLDNHNYQELNLKDKYGNTGFIWACRDYPELAEIMLERDDINFNIQNNLGHTGFIWACLEKPKLLKGMLNNKKVDKKLRDNDGLTGYDLAKKYNPKNFEIYQAWLTEQEKNHIKKQVQKKNKKPRQHL